MASLAWRRGGWELRYRDPAGRQRVERFPGEQTRKPPREATERLAAVERQLRWREYVGPEQRAVTFAEYYERWAAARQISRSKQYTDDGRAKRHVLPYWGAWRIGDIRPSDIDDWIAILSKKMGPWSVRQCYSILRGPLRRAVKDRVIVDPCIDIVLPKKPEIRKTFDDVLTAAEVDRLVAALADVGEKYSSLRTNGRYSALVFMGAWLGPRWNEAIGVRICDLDMLRREVTFGRLVVNQTGSETFTERGSKTDDWRTLPAPQPVIDALAEHIARYVPDPTDREAFLFTTNRGTHPLRSNFTREMRHALPRAGLTGRRVTWLTLRHTAASLMFDAGLTLFEVQQRLGHKDPTLTARVYTHLMRERFDEGRDRLEAYMAAKRQPGAETGG
ncbi:MAG TPA: tyrosine-type recombinase/integrase [Mycobacteriales bacterium]|nr:tyrosine-type recombinase/integrase [Mycobacteriales bacterium]